jgi:hypothetical protein
MLEWFVVAKDGRKVFSPILERELNNVDCGDKDGQSSAVGLEI